MDLPRLQQLAAMLRGNSQPATPAVLGNGMAQQAAQAMQSRPYQLHVREAQSMGQQPMTPVEFAAQGKGAYPDNR